MQNIADKIYEYLATYGLQILGALAIFILVKAINALKRKEAAKPSEPAPPSPEVVLLADIRDILRQRR
jgi:large conductance mechanosensitive channel